MADSQIALRANVVAVKPLEIDPAKLQEEVLDQMFTRRHHSRISRVTALSMAQIWWLRSAKTFPRMMMPAALRRWVCRMVCPIDMPI